LGVVLAAPEDVNTAERLQKILSMRPNRATSWIREQRR